MLDKSEAPVVDAPVAPPELDRRSERELHHVHARERARDGEDARVQLIQLLPDCSE